MASVSVVLLKLAPYIETGANLILGSQEEAVALKSKLEGIQKGLKYAEMKGVTDEIVKDWLKDLEEVMYQMDDALDKREMKMMELEIEQSEYEDLTGHWEKVCSLLTRICCLGFERMVGQGMLTLEMKGLSSRLDVLLKERGQTYNFVPNRSDDNHEPTMHETIAFVDVSKVVGRESDKDSIVQMLLSKHEKKGTVQVISVVGKGGLGKTTFAQLVYNDDSVDKHFDLKAWVSVPNPFDALKIAQVILESLDKSYDKSKSYSLENLRQRIQSVVLERNFLVVLDNVWTVDSQEWESLRNILLCLPGCRILVTTRDVTAAKTMDTTHLLQLGDLSEEACATILNTIALDGRSEAEQKQLEGIGSEIAKKCKGLPLAAKTIARMLRSRNTVEEWEVVRDSPMWRYEDEMGDTYNALRLSYADLSPILKRCFLSCALYPKGMRYRLPELTKIWMAQGYISSSATFGEVQKRGMGFFQVLLNRSFFQEREEIEGEITCKMHDVMHALAVVLARSEYYFIEGNGTLLQSAGRIHCCIITNFLEGEISLPNFMSYLKCVRVLSLMKCDLEEVPEEVGELIHLRYLDLSCNRMRELPDTLCNLYHLQTLDLRHSNITRLPHAIEKLVKLKHLLLGGSGVREYPRGFRKLTGLWTLDRFCATSDSIGYLENLNELTGSLRIDFENMEASEAEKANLKSKTRLESLLLFFYRDAKIDVIDAMVPPPGLSSFSMYMEGESDRLPSWITTITLIPNLKMLTFWWNNITWYSLPSLDKLSMLEKLQVSSMEFKRLGLMEFLGNGCGFSKLKTLSFWNCGSWEEWEDLKEKEDGDGGVVFRMPCLAELKLVNCPKLKSLPHKLLRASPRLSNLTIDDCGRLSSRYDKEFGADRDMISHIRYISISNMWG